MLQFLRVANFVLGMINISLFGLWFSLIRKDALPPGGDAANYMMGQVSIQLTILGLTIAVGAIFIAGLGVFGFQAVIERAEAKADQIAKDVIARRFNEIERDMDVSRRAKRVNIPNPEVGATEEN